MRSSGTATTNSAIAAMPFLSVVNVAGSGSALTAELLMKIDTPLITAVAAASRIPVLDPVHIVTSCASRSS